MKRLSVVLLVLLSLPVLCPAEPATMPTTAPITPQTPDDQIVQRINDATEAKDLKEMQQIAKTVHELFKQNDPQRFIRLSHKLASSLTTFNFDGKQQYLIASAIACEALESCTDETDIVIELELASRLRPQVLLDSPDQAGLRKRYLAAWSRAFGRLQAAATAPFDPKDRSAFKRVPDGFEKVLPFSGAGPGAIKDPELRKKYEAALRERNRRANEYTERHFARQRRPIYLTALTNFTTNLYAGQQRAKVEKELDEFLTAANLSAADKQRIVSRIEFAKN